jgi:hypothetical protein
MRVMKVDGKTFLKGQGSTSVPEKGSGTHRVQQENRHPKEGCSKPRQRQVFHRSANKARQTSHPAQCSEVRFFSLKNSSSRSATARRPWRNIGLATWASAGVSAGRFTQTWCVERIAETMWRLRRGMRAERGSSLVQLWNDQHYQKDSPWFTSLSTVLAEQCKLALLNTAWEEIQQTTTLSAATYAKVAPLVRGRGPTAVKASESEKTQKTDPAGTPKETLIKFSRCTAV